MASNPAYRTSTNECVLNADDYATLHTAGNTTQSYDTVSIPTSAQKYNVLQREPTTRSNDGKVERSIGSSTGGDVSYSSISGSVHYKVGKLA